MAVSSWVWEEQAHDARDQEDERHRVTVLAEECLPARLDGYGGELVGSWRARRLSASLVAKPAFASTCCAVITSSVDSACQTVPAIGAEVDPSIMQSSWKTVGDHVTVAVTR